MARKYVIEHMEEDDHSKVPPWVYLEYRHILELVHDPSRDPTSSPASSVLFSSLSEPSCKALQNELAPSPSSSSSSRGYETTLPPTATYEASTEPVLEKMKEAGLDISRVCLLDPKAEKVLEPGDGDRFDWFLFGGILGDDPPRDRTGELRRLGFPTRHLGEYQMTTDTAVGVTKLIVDDRVPMEGIRFVDRPTIRFDEHESVEMPFRYMVVQRRGTGGPPEVGQGGGGGEEEPRMPRGMRELLYKDLDRGFDDLL